MSAIQLMRIESQLKQSQSKLNEIEKGIDAINMLLNEMQEERQTVKNEIVEIEQQKMSVGKKYLGINFESIPDLVDEPVENIADLKAEADRLHKVMGGRQ